MLNFIRKSLMSKLILLFTGITLMIIYTVGYISFTSAKDALEESFSQSLTAVATGREDAVKLFLDMVMRETELLAANGKIQIFINIANKKERGDEVDEAALKNLVDDLTKIELNEFFEITDFFDYTIIGKNGRVQLSTNKTRIGEDLSQDENFMRGLKEKFFIDIAIDEITGKQNLKIVAPIFSHDISHTNAIGVIIAKAETLWLNNITANREGLGETGEVYIVNKDGFMITESRFEEGNVLKTKVDSMPVKLFQSQGKTMTGVYNDYRHRDVMGVSMGNKLKDTIDTGWVILSEIDRNEVLIPIVALQRKIILICFIVVTLVIIFGYFLSRAIARPIINISRAAQNIGEGDLEIEIESYQRSDEIGSLSSSFNTMVEQLRTAKNISENEDWLKTGIANLNNIIRSDQSIADLSTSIVTEVTTYINAQIGMIYFMEENLTEDPILTLWGAYAYDKPMTLSNQFKLGESLVGQAALEKQKKIMSNVPEDYIKIKSGLGETTPQSVAVIPFLQNDRVKGVIEFGSLSEITDKQLIYLDLAMPIIAGVIQVAQNRDNMDKTLLRYTELNKQLTAQQEELQTSNEELQSQQEELKTANEELEEQTRMLELSEEKLKVQQQELLVANQKLNELKKL